MGLLELGIVSWILIIGILLWMSNVHTDQIPSHDESRRYQELRKRPADEDYVVVRSFHYRRNAIRWTRTCERFHGTLQMVDSKHEEVIFSREIS